MPFAANPIGQGHYKEQSQAEEQPLPNVEASEALIRNWSDQPRVAGWAPYPMYWQLRAESALEIDAESGRLAKVHPDVFNHAHPDLVQDAIAPGQLILIEGMTEEPFAFHVPEPPATVRARIGAHEHAVTAPIDGVFLWLDAGKVVITQRARFDYVFRPEQIRCVSVS